jgi:hypothetical protein
MARSFLCPAIPSIFASAIAGASELGAMDEVRFEYIRRLSNVRPGSGAVSSYRAALDFSQFSYHSVEKRER